MGLSKNHGLLHWLKNLFWQRTHASPEIVQAKKLIAAIDRGGIPLYPAKVNAIARALGLEVSRKAAVEETIERIRAAITRST